MILSAFSAYNKKFYTDLKANFAVISPIITPFADVSVKDVTGVFKVCDATLLTWILSGTHNHPIYHIAENLEIKNTILTDISKDCINSTQHSLSLKYIKMV